MTAAAFRSLLGVAKETTPNTATTATNFLPVTAMKNSVKTQYIEDQGWRGSMVKTYDTILGAQHGEIDFGGNLAADTFGFLLASMLPDVVVTGSAAPYSTAFAPKNAADGQPPTLTVTDYDGVMTRQFAGAKLSDLGLKYNVDGLVAFTAKGMSLAPVNASAPTPSFSAVRATAGWQPVVTIGGTARTAVGSNLVLDASVDIKRPVEVVNAIDGTSSPAFIWSGPLEVTGKVTTVFDTTVDYLSMLNNQVTTLNITFTNGTGATQNGLALQMSAASFTAADVERGKNYVTLAIDYTARANTTDTGATAGYSPLKATLTNALPSGTYA